MTVLLNGQFVSEEQAVVSVADRSFLYGDGVFETIPVYHGKPFRWAQHLERLTRGADFLKIRLAFAPKELRGLAHGLTGAFLASLPQVRELLQTDVEAAYDGDPAALSKEEVIVAYPFVETIAVQRLAHQLYLKQVPLIPRIMTEWAHSRTGIDIHPGAKIGPHFFIDHGTGAVIGETCEIGSRVKLYHSVTLGARSFQKDEHGKIKKGGKRHPTLEDDVTIYPNSTVLGGETVIGARSTIGGNVFLVQSVPPDSLVYYEEKQLRIVPKRKHKPATTRDEFLE